jgi:arylsulfatase A-like enzyme
MIRFVLLAALSLASASARPNFVFILADDMGYMDIGANNPKSFYETPHIDSLAARGMRFTSGYAACNVCSPTRASILTGKYPARLGITNYIPGAGTKNRMLLPPANVMQLPLAEKTLAEALKDAGYTTFIAGKWHLGNDEFSPSAQGFPSGLEFTREMAGNYFPAGDDSKSPSKNDPKWSDRIAEATVKFIQSNKDQPFFAYLPFNAVHIKTGARADLIAKYTAKKASAPADLFAKEGDFQVNQVQNNPVYAAMIEQMDSSIGRVLDAIRQAGLAENTVVVFMTDNGGLSTAQGHPTSNLPLRAGKGWNYEGGLRTPWIIAAPGVTGPGAVCDTPVISTDFYPTLLDLAGLKPMPEQHVDGTSLLPLLKGSEMTRAPLFWHYPHYSDQGGQPGGAIREGDWKLIEWYEDHRIELYNLREDIGESRNLAEKHPEKAAALLKQFHDWRKSVNAKMPTPNPRKKPNPIPK